MDMRLPAAIGIVIAVAAAALVAAHLVRSRRGGRYRGGTRAANTRYAKSLPEYEARRRRWKAAMVAIECLLCSSLLATAFLVARPSETLTQEGDERKRDIFLCLDISYSVYAQNGQLVESLKDIVRGLDGDRFGISIFNCSSIIYVPMTDDYDYVLEELDELSEYFAMQAAEVWSLYHDPIIGAGEDPPEGMPEPDPALLKELEEDPEGWLARLNEVEAGVNAGYARGSSLIGEGLATCLYSFPHLDDQDRTRIVILSTDNDPAAIREDVDLVGAGGLCEKHGVTVYGVMPSEKDLPGGHGGGFDKAEKEFDGVCSGTGGKLYVTGSGKMDVSDAVADIRQKEAQVTRKPASKNQIDRPEVAYAALRLAIAATATLVGVTRPW